MSARPIPEGFTAVTPFLTVKSSAKAIEFYKKVFGATEVLRLGGPDGLVAHAEIKIGDAMVMLADEVPEWGNLSPQTVGGSPVRLHLYCEDVDAVADRAVKAGAKILLPVADQFYGDRAGRIEDPFGHVWIIGTHKVDMSPEKIQASFEAFMKQRSS